MAKPNLMKLQEELQGKVEKEYSMWFEHIRSEIERKRDVLNKLFDPTLETIRIPLFKKNLELENALFLTDDINIEFLTNLWALWEEIMKNANLVAKYDDVDMDLYEMREDIVNYNWLYGLAATIIDSWDDEEKQPISDSIHPLNLIIDPKNYKGSKLRFIGVRRRLNYEDVENNPSFDKNQVEKIEWLTDTEISETERSQDYANNQRHIEDNDWMVDIYDHFTVHNWKKVLTTWWADRTILLRYVEIEPLTSTELKRPTKVKFPIQLHRRKPRVWSVFWFSIADEVLVYQDNISILTNLQLINARIQALWPDTFIDDRLWLDTTIMSQGKPGWRILPISNQSWMPTQNGIYTHQLPAPSQYTDLLIDKLEQRAEETTSISKQNFGITQQWQQTKAEIQTLQQNANNILAWISNNYLRWQKEYWTAHYRSYALNMWKGKKVVSMFQKWNAISLDLTRDDFIADWKVQVIVVSKNQQTLENDKEFNKLTFISSLYLPNITSEYAKNSLLRLMWDKSNVRDFDATKYIRESIDEIKAKQSLPLINRDVWIDFVAMPGLQSDVDVYIDIYKQAMDTDTKAEVMTELYKIKEIQWTTPQQTQWQWDEVVKNIAMNNINQQQPVWTQPWL